MSLVLDLLRTRSGFDDFKVTLRPEPKLGSEEFPNLHAPFLTRDFFIQLLVYMNDGFI